ncbi:MAG: hypothetical protein RML95_00350 [Anaerolineae bacterium]|nr:hypothetical protein [Anaerolineae bacterium]MDW8297767.1 hypothetical protein [Anaerolineae bacterium]
MRLRQFLRSLLLLTIAVGISISGIALAAQNPQVDFLPPAILSFTSDARTITVEAIESGAAQIVLSWQTVGLTDDYSLRLFALVVSEWTPLTDQNLPPVGSARLVVQPSLDFSPPTYRLAIFDRQNRLINQHIVTLPFDTTAPLPTPQIVSFEATVGGVDFVELGQNRARVPVTWRVRGRVPTSNLVFEQLLPDGRAVSVELPRLSRWIASSGEGVVAPILPDNDALSIQLRLRVLDLATGTVYAEQVITLPIIRDGSPLPTATAPIAPPPPVVLASPTPAN